MTQAVKMNELFSPAALASQVLYNRENFHSEVTMAIVEPVSTNHGKPCVCVFKIKCGITVLLTVNK